MSGGGASLDAARGVLAGYAGALGRNPDKWLPGARRDVGAACPGAGVGRCARCGQYFVAAGPPPPYCSPGCRRGPGRSAACAGCGAGFVAYRATAAFCSPTCRSRAHRAGRVTRAGWRRCRSCGAVFTPARKDQRFCSKACRKKFHSRGR